MSAKEETKKKLDALVKEWESLTELDNTSKSLIKFSSKYQSWYSRALKIVVLLGSDRLEEFRSYYLIDPKRKNIDASNYVIQDYIKGIGRKDLDSLNVTTIRLITQLHILESLASRIDGVLADVEGKLFAELQDEELKAAQKIITINLRAAGTVAGVVLERHLQRVAMNHGVKINKKAPTISDLNDPLKQASVYDTPAWRKIQLLADLRNLCSHNKHREPSREEVEELITGTNTIIKTIY